LKLLNEKNSNSNIVSEFPTGLLSKNDSSQMTFVVKDYRNPAGLSSMINNGGDNDRFEVRGPFGHGLKPSSSGVHIAFAAGTGVLCFVDLVAALIQFELNVGIRSTVNAGQATIKSSILENDLHQVQFHLYVSFPRRSESIALEMFEAFDTYCKRNNIKIFSLHLRLSQEKVNAARWDEAFISQEIRKHGVKNIQRVWVCGPPVMNETFDRVFSAQPANGAAVQEGEPLL